MSQKIERFFKKHSFSPADIKYIVREDGKTVIYLLDERTIQTYNTIKEFKESLSMEDFLYPNKGIILAAAQVINVREGTYEMVDGRTFKYRVHNSILHDNRLLMLGRRMEHVQAAADTITAEASLSDRFAVMDKMPMPTCVLELTFEDLGRGADFVIRYCNDEMSQFEQIPKDELLDHSIFEVLKHTDSKFFAAYFDVAVNDTVRIVEKYIPQLDKNVYIHCYQPTEGYCACVMVI
ncbi:MAG: LytTR family transcriptional regulator DNA-binding domain-containing protein [Oscillospiraceae bacterium]|nr:LytTR family transcriptional regulator DNA-binding domain-containing protein [Oscillospiraceae bacterium]